MTNFIECNCPRCIELCMNGPGWFTVKEAKLAIQNGYANKLMLDYYFDRDDNKKYYVLSPAIIGFEGKLYTKTDDEFSIGKCVLLNDNKLCDIHNSGFKPIQCKTALPCYATNKKYRSSILTDLYNINNILPNGMGNNTLGYAWDNDGGKKLIEDWKLLVNFDNKKERE